MSLNFANTQLMSDNLGSDYPNELNTINNMNNMNNMNNFNFDNNEEPIFTLERVNYKPDGITSMLVCNGVIAMTTKHNHVLRLDLKDQNSEIEEIRMSGEIYKIFLDPTGNHLLICMVNEEIHYLHALSNSKKPKLQKWKVDLIESVGWDNSSPDRINTQTILIGSNKGRIYETVVSNVEKSIISFSASAPLYKLLYTFEENEPILGMSLEKLQNKNFLMVSTPSRLYYFSQTGTYEQLFDRSRVNFDIIPEDPTMPSTKACGEIKIFSKQNGTMPQSYAWLISSGIHYGDLAYKEKEKFTTSTMMLHFKQDEPVSSITSPTTATVGGAGSLDRQQSQQQQQQLQQQPISQSTIPPYPPVSFAITEFHFLLVYEDRFIALSKLNYQIVYEYYFNQKDVRLRSIAIDSTDKSTWICGDNILFELRITKEDRDVWKLYMDKGLFDIASTFVHAPFAEEKLDKIWQTQAEHYFKEERYELAATFFGKTRKVFEEITLKFINANQRDALKTYLLQKLINLNRGQETQKTIICTWLIEIFISKLNTLRDPSSKDRYNKVNSEFRQFLENFKDTLIVIKDITFNIISSHGAIDELLFYANLIEDYERVISYHIQHQQYENALSILTTLDKKKVQQQLQPQPNNKQQQQQQQQDQSNLQQHELEELFYKFCPVLFHFIPYQTCEAWIQTKPGFLNPRKLIPSLMRYDPTKNPAGQPNQAIRYLQYCVQKQKNTDRALHNYLLSLYVKQEDDRPLLEFLNGYEVYYDLKYALRLCMRERKLKACVYIYGAMELYEEAVDLALSVDIDLAKENADKVRDTDEELCKKLWLRIAEHQVKKDGNIKQAMEFLKACPLLKIEDILPFFPNFTVIDDFKEEICKSLEDYNSYIDELKAAMDDATKSAQQIRKDIQNLRNKYGYVRGDQKCDICSYPVLSKRFYLFSCHHVFHSDCLITQLMKHLPSHQRQRIRELQMSINNDQILNIQNQHQQQQQQHQNVASGLISNISSILGKDSNLNDSQQIDEKVSQEDLDRNELDRIIGKECLYCGDIMIRSIEQPFIDPNEIDTINSWEI